MSYKGLVFAAAALAATFASTAANADYYYSGYDYGRHSWNSGYGSVRPSFWGYPALLLPGEPKVLATADEIEWAREYEDRFARRRYDEPGLAGLPGALIGGAFGAVTGAFKDAARGSEGRPYYDPAYYGSEYYGEPDYGSAYRGPEDYREPGYGSAYRGPEDYREPGNGSAYRGPEYSREPGYGSAYRGPEYYREPGYGSAYRGPEDSREPGYASAYRGPEYYREPGYGSAYGGSAYYRGAGYPTGWGD